MVKAVIFDLDGTLLDTLPDILSHVNGMLRAYSYPEISIEETRSYIGDGARKLVERALPVGAENVDECFAYFKKSYAASDNALTKLFDGETEFLQRLKAKGLKTAVVTNKPQDATEGCVRKFFKDMQFDFVGGDSGAFPCKPDPSLARYAALSMRVSPAECVFAGDGETDVLTAKNAGMFGVACLWGYRSRSQLEAAGATRFARDFDELEKFLQIG